MERYTGAGRLSQGRTQLLDYLHSGTYIEGYVAIPFEERRLREGSPEKLGVSRFEDVGILTINKKGDILFRECTQSYGVKYKIKELLSIVRKVVKLTLMKNLPLSHISNLLPNVQSFYDLYAHVDSIDIENIIDEIKN